MSLAGLPDGAHTRSAYAACTRVYMRQLTRIHIHPAVLARMLSTYDARTGIRLSWRSQHMRKLPAPPPPARPQWIVMFDGGERRTRTARAHA